MIDGTMMGAWGRIPPQLPIPKQLIRGQSVLQLSSSWLGTAITLLWVLIFHPKMGMVLEELHYASPSVYALLNFRLS